MSFEAIAIKQAVQVKLTGKGTTMEGTLPSVSAGSTLVVIGSGICESTWDALLLTSVSGGGSWGTPRNAASVFSYVPNVFACEAPNVSASASPVTVTLTVNGASNNKATWLLLEIEKSVASNVVDKFITAIDATGVSPATLASTGTLSQTDNLVLAALGGWTDATVASMESAGFTTLIAQANGSYLGLYVGWKKVTSVAGITQTIPHSAAGANAAALLVLKAADADTPTIDQNVMLALLE